MFKQRDRKNHRVDFPIAFCDHVSPNFPCRCDTHQQVSGAGKGNVNSKKDDSAGKYVPISGRNHQPLIEPDVSRWLSTTSSEASDFANARGMLPEREEYTGASGQDDGHREV